MTADNRDGRSDASTFRLPGASAADLRGRQSVRATFRLSAEAIETLSIAAVHLGIKQKSLFDHLIEDIQALDAVAKELETFRIEAHRRVQKTYVLSRRTLQTLEQACRQFDTPRDMLVECSIQRLLPIIAREKRKHELRKKLFADLRHLTREGRRILTSARESLGPGDPFCDRMEGVQALLENAQRDMDAYIQKGKMIENF
ncbi:MAG: hypothetical protein WBG37_07710 [Desulfobacterales bacterium]|jgi:predicted unusual protein kinase regulating ubiquinone biosynthesis (AarF/ABC1/UbiB family)